MIKSVDCETEAGADGDVSQITARYKYIRTQLWYSWANDVTIIPFKYQVITHNVIVMCIYLPL